MQTTPNDTNEHMEKTQTAEQRKNKYNKAMTKKTRKEIQKLNTITWESPDGKTTRQIDYLSINHRYRNAVRRAYAVKGWQANMAQQKQHKVIQMDIRLKLMKHYKEDQPPETGLQIHYDIKKLREDPQKAERWLTQRNAPPEIAPETTAEEDWEK